VAFVDRTVPFDAASERRRSLLASNRVLAWLDRFESRRAQRFVFALALLLCSPTIFTGFALDDYVLLSRMSQPSASDWAGSAPFDLFRWLDPTHNLRLIDGLGLPWWTFPNARCAFLRPFSSLSHVLDYALAPHSALLMHVHSLLWFALLLWLASKAYNELLDNSWVVGMASAMFALDSAHGAAICWISNRNALMSGALGIAAFLCHRRARRTGSFGFAFTAWLYFALALLSGELAVGAAGYLLAYTLFCDPATPRRRALALLPYGIVLVGFAFLHVYGQYGSYGIGAYVDPLAEPLEFLRTAPLRWAILLASQVGRLAAEFYTLGPARYAPLLTGLAIATTISTVWFVWPVLRRYASARCFALGALLSILPLAATIPADRLLVLVGFGLMPVLAQAIADVLQPSAARKAEPPPRWLPLRRLLAYSVVGVHLVIEPLVLPVAALSTAYVARWTEAANASLPVSASLPEQTVIVASVPDSVLLTYLPSMRDWAGKPRPEKLYWLDAMPGEAVLERRASDTLRVSAREGLFDRRSEARGQGVAFKPGDKVVLSEMTIEILELNRDGLPSVCDFVFAHALESSKYVWQTWQDGKLRSFQVPKLGETRTIWTDHS
jgi:hypothetical protein